MSLASSAEREAPHLAVAGPTADPREVMMAALAGIGQLAAHDGSVPLLQIQAVYGRGILFGNHNFSPSLNSKFGLFFYRDLDKAEDKLSEAIRVAESLSGVYSF